VPELEIETGPPAPPPAAGAPEVPEVSPAAATMAAEVAAQGAAPLGEESIDLAGEDDDGEVPELEVDSDLSEAEMDALIQGTDEELTASGQRPAPAAAAQPAPAEAGHDLFDAVGTDLQGANAADDDDDDFELGS
jgi:hypothetical protein